MTKAKRMMQEDIKLIDIVIELLDARAPLSSKNPDIDNLAANKSRMVIWQMRERPRNGKSILKRRDSSCSVWTPGRILV